MTTYQQEIEKKIQQEQVAELQRKNDLAWRQIVDTYPLKDCTANRRIVEDYCNGVITIDKFQFLQQNPPKGYQLAWGEEWQSLLQEILGMLYDPYGRRMTDHDLRQQAIKMSFWTRAQLRARRDELALKQQLNKKTATELREDLRKAREVKRPYPGFPTLLPTTVPKYTVPEMGWNTIHAIPTGDYMRWLAKHDIFLFKRYAAIYSMNQLTYWLNN